MRLSLSKTAENYTRVGRFSLVNANGFLNYNLKFKT